MNKAILMGRLTRDPVVRYSNVGYSQEQLCIARYTLAIDRKTKDAGTDFIPVVAFGKAGEFVNKYFRKGMKVVVTGHIQTGGYINKDGNQVYTTDIIAEDQEFAESKAAGQTQPGNGQSEADEHGFINIPEGIDEDLPFS